MSSVNLVILVGNLGADPDLRYLADGSPVCNIRLATTDTWKDKATGEKKEATEWHRVVLYRKLGEIAAQFLKKGSAVYIEGRVKTRKWQDKDGKDRFTTEVETSEMKMLGSRPAGSRIETNENGAPTSDGSLISSDTPWEDDIPF